MNPLAPTTMQVFTLEPDGPFLAGLQEPLDGAAQAVFQRGVAGKPQPVQAGHVEDLVDLAVGLGCVPDDFAGEAGGFLDGFGQFADGNAAARRDVDGFAGVVVPDEPRHGGGHVDAVPVTPQEVEVQVKAGKAKILAVLAPKRLEEISNVPTAEELGFKNLVFTIWRGFGVPKGTPKEIVTILRDGFKAVLDDPTVTEFMATKHFAKDFRNSQDFYAMMEREEAAYAKQDVKLGLKK